MDDMAHEIKVGQHGEGCKCPHCSIYWPYAQWKEADQTKCETLRKKKGGHIMAHEKEKAQYEEDRKNHERPWELWEFRNPVDYTWTQLSSNPAWVYSYDYRRKEPPFQPQYFSGLNWREAEMLVGRAVNASKTGDEWSSPLILTSLNHDCMSSMKFMVGKFGACRYIRTCLETHAHPTITIGGVKLARPEVDVPPEGTPVFIFSTVDRRLIWEDQWINSKKDKEWLDNGCTHLTESRAQAWADWWQETVVKVVRAESKKTRREYVSKIPEFAKDS